MYSNLTYDYQRTLFDDTAKITLKGAPNPIGRKGVYERLDQRHKVSVELLKKHIKLCEPIYKIKKNKDGKSWYIPPTKENVALRSYIVKIYHLEEKDCGYWKKKAFSDSEIELSQYDQGQHHAEWISNHTQQGTATSQAAYSMYAISTNTNDNEEQDDNDEPDNIDADDDDTDNFL